MNSPDAGGDAGQGVDIRDRAAQSSPSRRRRRSGSVPLRLPDLAAGRGQLALPASR
jgi:hypothetical protein